MTQEKEEWRTLDIWIPTLPRYLHSDGRDTQDTPTCSSDITPHRMEFQQGEYCGDLVEGLPHGLGTMLYRPEDPLNREAYEGEWAGGCQCGEGSMKFRSGDTYQGSFQARTCTADSRASNEGPHEDS